MSNEIKEVKRYDLYRAGHVNDMDSMELDSKGDYVKFSDYSSMSSELKRVKEENEELQRQVGVQYDLKCKVVGEKHILQSDNEAYKKRVEELEDALHKVAKWETPLTGKCWDDGSPTSYETEHGSNGVRDYFKALAMDALNSNK